jgi:porin
VLLKNHPAGRRARGPAAVSFLLAVLFQAAAAGLGVEARADGGQDPPPPSPAQDRTGFENTLEDRGITPELTYLGEAFSTVFGGLRRGPVAVHNLSLTLSFDLRKLAGWKGATLFVYGMGIAGGNPERHIGDIQGVSNIAAPSAVRLYEAWLRQDLAGGRLSLLAGIHDLNSEFDVIEAASVFLNPSQGIDPTFAFSGLNGPSVFPYTTLGFQARLRLGGFYLQSAVMNGLAGDPADPDATRIIIRRGNGILLVAEAGYRLPLTLRRYRNQEERESIRRYIAPAYAGKIALGLWSYTARFAPILPRTGEAGKVGGNRGLYFLLSRGIWHSRSKPEARNLVAFARAGLANPRINRLGFFAGGGLSFAGLVPKRTKDIAGLAFAAAFNGNDFMTKAELLGSPVRRTEWNLELTYQARILPWLDLHPDIQYVIHPGLAPAVPNALGFDIRVEISL